MGVIRSKSFAVLWISRIYPSRDRSPATAGKGAGRAFRPTRGKRSHAQPALAPVSMARPHPLPAKAGAVADVLHFRVFSDDDRISQSERQTALSKTLSIFRLAHDHVHVHNMDLFEGDRL